MPASSTLSRDEATLIQQYPLAWICLTHGREQVATAVPMTVGRSTASETILNGHVPRRAAIVSLLEREPTGLLLFLGPHAYISPSWLRDRTRGPTWNFASVQVQATLTIRDDQKLLDSHLGDLTALLEEGQANPWQTSEMGTRYDELCQHIVAFDARIEAVSSRFKLGQDEPDDVFADIMRHLGQSSETELHEYMSRFNSGRDQ